MSHHPLAHHQIIEALIEALAFRHIAVAHDEYAVSVDGMKMFGVLDLEATFEGCRLSIGIRNSNDKSMRLAMTVGLSLAKISSAPKIALFRYLPSRSV